MNASRKANERGWTEVAISVLLKMKPMKAKTSQEPGVYNSLHLIGLGGVIFAFVRYFDDDDQPSEGSGPDDQAIADGKATSGGGAAGGGREVDTAASVQGALLCLTSASLALQGVSFTFVGLSALGSLELQGSSSRPALQQKCQ